VLINVDVLLNINEQRRRNFGVSSTALMAMMAIGDGDDDDRPTD
jgi:hypothetical protein